MASGASNVSGRSSCLTTMYPTVAAAPAYIGSPRRAAVDGAWSPWRRSAVADTCADSNRAGGPSPVAPSPTVTKPAPAYRAGSVRSSPTNESWAMAPTSSIPGPDSAATIERRDARVAARSNLASSSTGVGAPGAAASTRASIVTGGVPGSTRGSMPHAAPGMLAPMWAFTAVALAAPCDEPRTVEAFRRELDAAWRSAIADDRAAVRERVLWLDAAVACVLGPLDPVDAAAFHRDRAVEARWSGDGQGALAAAAAAVRLAPDAAAVWAAELPEFAQLVEHAPTAPMTEDFGTSLAAMVYVDGARAPRRPMGHPVVVQAFDPVTGTPLSGAWVDHRDPLPDWVALPKPSCTDEVAVDDLVGQVLAAEEAYAALDVTAFEAALQAVAAGLPCVTVRLATPQAAAIHRLEGIRQYTYGAETSALRSFQEARALDPLHQPTEATMPPGSTLHALWELAGRAGPSPLLVERIPEGLALVVDGIPATVRPAALPSIVQVTAPTGTALWTRYVPPGAQLPDLEPERVRASRMEWDALPPATRRYLAEGQARAGRNRTAGLAVTGAACLTLSAAFYVTNAVAVSEFEALDTERSRLAGLVRTANTSATASSLLLVAGTGLVGASIVLR